MAPMNERNVDTVDEADISICKFCKANIVWLESKKKPGKKYPVNIYNRGPDYANVKRNDFHECSERQEAIRHGR